MSTWTNKGVQYPRLLAEIRAVGLTPEQYRDLGASMDLSRDEIDEVLEWAESDWQTIKDGNASPDACAHSTLPVQEGDPAICPRCDSRNTCSPGIESGNDNPRWHECYDCGDDYMSTQTQEQWDAEHTVCNKEKAQ